MPVNPSTPPATTPMVVVMNLILVDIITLCHSMALAVLITANQPAMLVVSSTSHRIKVVVADEAEAGTGTTTPPSHRSSPQAAHKSSSPANLVIAIVAAAVTTVTIISPLASVYAASLDFLRKHTNTNLTTARGGSSVARGDGDTSILAQERKLTRGDVLCTGSNSPPNGG